MSTCRSCRHASRGQDAGTCVCHAQNRIVPERGQTCGQYAISARAYLESIGNATRRLEDMSYRAKRYRELASRATGSMEACRTSGVEGGSKVSRNIDACIDLAQEINQRAARLKERYTAACEMIEGVAYADEREVLELRFLRGMRWEEIGKRMRYDERSVRRISRSALEDVQRQMDERGIRA